MSVLPRAVQSESQIKSMLPLPVKPSVYRVKLPVSVKIGKSIADFHQPHEYDARLNPERYRRSAVRMAYSSVSYLGRTGSERGMKYHPDFSRRRDEIVLELKSVVAPKSDCRRDKRHQRFHSAPVVSVI